MPDTRKSRNLSQVRVDAIVRNERIWRHLVKSGFISERGDIIAKDEYKRHVGRRHAFRSAQRRPLSARYPSFELPSSRPMEYTSVSTKEKLQLQSSNNDSNDRRIKNASNTHSIQRNKSTTSTRFPASSQCKPIETVLLRRAISPEILPAEDRCCIRLKYFGPELNVEYNRSLFIPSEDEVLVLQQHCGGENLAIFKGLVKPNEIFSMTSLRHPNYPFALAFYINGVIDCRLSVCCEFRCNEKRISGKHGLFAVVQMENHAPCRRCRFETRMNKFTEDEKKAEAEKKKAEEEAQLSSSNKASTVSNEQNSNSPTSSRSVLEKRESNGSNSKSSTSSTLDSKPNTIDEQAVKTSPSPTERSTTIQDDDQTHSQTKDSNSSRSTSPKVNRDTPIANDVNTSSSIATQLDRSSPKPTGPGSGTITLPESTSIRSPPHAKPVNGNRDSFRSSGLFASSPEPIQSDISSIEDENEALPPANGRSPSPPKSQPHVTNSVTAVDRALEVEEESWLSEKDSHELTPAPASSTQPTKNNSNKEFDRASVVSSVEDNIEDVPVTSDDSNDDFEEALAARNKRDRFS